MKYISILSLLIFMIGCKKETPKKETETIFYVGTYTNKESKGIYKYAISDQGKLKKIALVAAITNPSFLAKSKNEQTLFAVSETDINGTGFIRSYAIKKDSLQLISKQESGGANPCFIAVNDENFVIAANYSGGNVGLLKADEKGELSQLLDVQQHTGKGTTNRQESAHAHSVWFHHTKNEIISVDLGTNELWFSTFNKDKNKLVFTSQKTLKMKEGAGPRHLSFHPNNKWIYVLNELNNTVSLIKNKNNIYFIDTAISTLPKDFKAFSKAADIHVSKDGKFLYASNRGHESIAIFKINAKDGRLKIVDYQSVFGKHPRNFSFSLKENFLLVANQDTDNIISFKRNSFTGLLKMVDSIAAPSPVCILF